MEKQYIDLSKISSADTMFLFESIMELTSTMKMAAEGDYLLMDAYEMAAEFEEKTNEILDRIMVGAH